MWGEGKIFSEILKESFLNVDYKYFKTSYGFITYLNKIFS